jgi:hypothetical protein
MVVLALTILTDLEDDRIENASDPSNRSVLFRDIRALVEIKWAGKQLLHFFETNAPPWIVSQGFALRLAELESHKIMV